MFEVKNLSVVINKKPILKDINFSIADNKTVLLAGVSGSGKTSLIQAIMQLMPRKTGNFFIDTRPVKHEDYQRMVLIPDNLPYTGKQTLNDLLNFMKAFYPNYSDERLKQINETLKLDLTSQLANLSKGNQAKANLLAGLSVDADYYLMDEPFSGIDFIARDSIVQLFTTELFIDKGVLLSTHEINSIDLLVDEALIIHDGKIVRSFDTESVREIEGKSINDYILEVYHE
ncbi:ATP-binding cassette domain-containing protein [Fundicoccus sp. Sow4_H7]|uniref:ATP-binding cassette domain-containing protein n=1 Tax=Fundicoccus sp. Sow4_H7 TaxID=3438784 RepID=UPI003F91BE75